MKPVLLPGHTEAQLAEIARQAPKHVWRLPPFAANFRPMVGWLVITQGPLGALNVLAVSLKGEKL